MSKFRIGRTENHILSSKEVAELLYDTANNTRGFIIARMAYMSQYRQTFKFSNVTELSDAIDQYCRENNTQDFDFSCFYICFVIADRLKKVEVEILKTKPQYLEQYTIQNGCTEEANVFRKLFNNSVKGVEPGICYALKY